MILVNVLMFVAIASGLVLLMITREESALDRASRIRESARALAVVRGGELSAVVALRRDLTEAPDADYPGEPWGKLAESGAPIEGGTFDLAIADAQGRFNINNLRDGRADTLELWQRIGTAAGLTPDQLIEATALVRSIGPVPDLRLLALAGLDPAVTARLNAMVTALPGETAINMNSADAELLGIVLQNQEAAQKLVALRTERGRLTRSDVAEAEVWMPNGLGFTSGTFWVRTRASIGETSQQAAALIVRRMRPDGKTPEVAAVARWRNAAVPPEAPALG